MDIQQVEKNSFRYTLLFRAVRFYFRIYYRRITLTGKERIPENVPLIYAANHQNALMDALTILFTAGRPVVFLARADIFKKKFIARLLYFLKMLPIYRIRDGVDAMSQNQQVFSQTVRVLESGTPLALLPEGTHSLIKRLRQLKKGICRIAFLAAESSDFKLNIHIVPVGLDYSNSQKAGTHLLVNYGNPIAVAGYYDLYRENPQKAIAKLRDDLSVALKKVMIHVENEEFYQPILSLNEILLPSCLKAKGLENNRLNRFSASSEILERIEEASTQNKINLPQLQEDIKEYHDLLDRYKLKNHLLESAPPSIRTLLVSLVYSILLLPVHLYGMILNYLPYKLPEKVSGKMKDQQFISSVNFALSFILFPVWYLLLFAVLMMLTGKLLPVMLIAITWPLTGLFTFYNYRRMRKLAGSFRLFFLKSRQPEKYRQLLDIREKLIHFLPD